MSRTNFYGSTNGNAVYDYAHAKAKRKGKPDAEADAYAHGYVHGYAKCRADRAEKVRAILQALARE